MDPITQGLLGTAAAQLTCRRRSSKASGPSIWWVGALSAMAPDLDVIFGLHSNPMVGMYYHRHFTHSLFFIPFGAALVALILWLLYRRKISFSFYYKVALVGWATHGLLDALTTYGTVLFWPFSSHRVAMDSMPIVDLFFTGTLFLGCLYTEKKKDIRGVRIASIVASLYMLFGFYQHGQAQSEQMALAQKRGHQMERSRVMPGINNLFFWRSIYAYKGRIYADGIYVLPGGRRSIVEGQSEELLPLSSFSSEPKSLQEDAADFYWFSDGWVVGRPQHFLDARYSAQANEVSPMWGFTVGPDGQLKRWRNRKMRQLRGEKAKELIIDPWLKAFGL